MHIVIKLPDGFRERLNKYEVGSIVDIQIRNAVRKAVILPKDHGRLIDIDHLPKEFLDCVLSGPYAGQTVQDVLCGALALVESEV